MKPILFSAEMVRAIQDLRKTQTRRVIKPQPPEFADWFERKTDGFKAYMAPGEPCDYPLIKAPYKPGDILWVRETWRIGAWNEDIGCIAVDYKADNYARREWIRIKDEERFKRYWIESTDDAIKAGVEPDENGEYHWEPRQAPTKWRPSIFMPREAARLFLKVTSVKVERLQEITEEDARAEGVLWERARKINQLETSDSIYDNAKALFMRLWDSINAKRGYGWDKNPWVWVIEFERISKEEAKRLEGMK